MEIRTALGKILAEVQGVLDGVEPEAVGRLLDAVASARRIYVAGEGRSGLVARTFAMRLVHLGLTAYACGETITPAIGAGDLCIACSGSGETPITCHRAAQSRKVGATVAAIVAARGSALGSSADFAVVLPAPTKVSQRTASRQFGATLFEQALLLFLDALVLLLQERRGASPESMRAKHTNLE
ncbi:MAG TPA: 6-phospho-3-hexuloisomerase [Planctomycetota bacterium]|nr:6-phospho-3-hexuloisomerase [Planctomycetota bacterium]